MPTAVEAISSQIAGIQFSDRLTKIIVDDLLKKNERNVYIEIKFSPEVYAFTGIKSGQEVNMSNAMKILPSLPDVQSSRAQGISYVYIPYSSGTNLSIYQAIYQSSAGVVWYQVYVQRYDIKGSSVISWEATSSPTKLWLPLGTFGNNNRNAKIVRRTIPDTSVDNGIGVNNGGWNITDGSSLGTIPNTSTNNGIGVISPTWNITDGSTANTIPSTSTNNGMGIVIDSSTGEVVSNSANESVLDEFIDDFKSLFYEDDKEYFHDLYWFKRQTFSAKSFNSIIGMPVQFMANVDQRYGTSTFGRQFSENILYDAPIAVIHVGSPTLNDSTFYGSTATGLQGVLDGIAATFSWMGAIKQGHSEDVLKTFLANWLMGGYNRFYGFQSEYNRYIQYVNTLCHVFASYLGIANETLPGTNTKYINYSDAIEDIELADNGLSMKMRYGNYPGAFIYYQPDSSLSQTFNNMTQESSLASKLNEVSNYTKEMSFLAGTLGFPGKGITVGADVDAGTLFGLGDTTFSFGNNILQRIFNRASEGVGTIIAGCNLALPEIYSGSTMSGTEYTLNIKLVNPYGTPEAAFLFQMRQLARLLALSLPRQYGPNGYTAPFILRAFSKGQFNVQLGIVESLTIRRAGQGGENQTVHDIPMELDVTMVIKDLYQQFAISNEYGTLEDGLPILRTPKKLKLLFNNVGLLDFIASYAGYNMNQPQIDMQIDYLRDTMYNELTDIVDFNGSMEIKDWKFPRWDRMMTDAFMNTVESRSTFLGH